MTTTADRKLAWEAIADRLDSLGLKLKIHFEDADGLAKDVNEAFEQLGTAIEAAFSAIAAAVQDPAVREDANTLGASLGDVLADTLAHGRQELEEMANALRCHRAGIRNETPE